MLLGGLSFADDCNAVLYPLVLGGVSIIASIIGTFFVKVKRRRLDHGRAVQGRDRVGACSSAVAFWFVTHDLMAATRATAR